MEKKIQWEPFKIRFHKSWHDKIKPFFETEDCYNILNKLTEEAKSGKTILPGKQLIWRCFQETRLDDLKILFLGLSPYFTVGVPDGLAFSCGITKKEQPSLKILLDACENNIGYKDSRNPDLKRWANQGVLLLNSSLTTLPNDARCHLELWSPFIKFLFKNVFNDKNIAIVYFGKDAQVYKEYENKDLHKSLNVNHPSYFARNNMPMEHKNLFTWCNTIVKENGKSEINWLEYKEKLIFEGDKEYEEFI